MQLYELKIRRNIMKIPVTVYEEVKILWDNKNQSVITNPKELTGYNDYQWVEGVPYVITVV